MRTAFAFALLLAACAGARSPGDRFTFSVVGDADAPQWQAFRSEDARFGVEFPAAPARSVAQDGAGALDLFAARLAGASYLVGAAPVEAGGPEAQARALDAYRAELLARLGGDVTADARATVGGWPARDLEIAPARGGVTRVRVVATPARVYLVSVATEAEALPPEAGRFLASFRAEP